MIRKKEYIYNIDYDMFDYYSILCDILNDYEKKLNQYISSMYYEGLNEIDYEKIKDILIELKIMKESVNNKAYNHRKLDLDNFYLKQIETLQNYFYKIYKNIEKNVIPKTLKEELMETSSLLHLVFTNNKNEKIKLYSDASVMFSCQFHRERTPSFGVTDNRGLCHCFGCGASFNVVSYIKEYENLNYHETVQLLSKIYMINIENNRIDENDPLVAKYRNSLLSNEFNELLIKINNRLVIREEKNYRSMVTCLAIERIKHNFETIERIRRKEYKDFVNNKTKQKRLILKMPSFD